MRESVVFFHIKDPAVHPLTSIGFKSIDSDGKVIVYCTEEGPLDSRYHSQWLEWRASEGATI